MKPHPLFALLALAASTCSAARAQDPAAALTGQELLSTWKPLPRPDNWPFVMTSVPTPYWASPNYPHGYYASNKDRPIMTGTSRDGALWQTQQMQKWLPGGVLIADIFADAEKTQGPGQFGNYIEAARKVAGARVFPLLEILLSDYGPPQKREDATYVFFKMLLDTFGRDPHWFNVGGVPVITDYSTGGLGIEGVARVSARLARDGYKFYWLSDTTGTNGLLAALYGEVNDEGLKSALKYMSGTYSFGSPVNYSRGGFPKLQRLIRAHTPPRVFGMGTSPGGYSARGNQRNYEAALGTARMRRDLEAALVLKPDVLNAQTWNDYVESAHVEPSYKHSSALLEIMRHYNEEIRAAPHQSSEQPHLFASYRKAIFAGEALEIELLNLPVAQPFGAIRATVTLRDSKSQVVGRGSLSLRGGQRDAPVLRWRAPSAWAREMLDVQIEVESSGPRPFRRLYRNLPPIPVFQDGALADPLTFSVPLHRLYTAQPVQTLVNGSPQSRALPLPRLLHVRGASTFIPTVEGISYLRSGAIINDPFSETARGPLIDNWPNDPFRPRVPAHEYYGSLVQFGNGQLAYGRGLWVGEPATEQGRVWADYHFMGDFEGSGEYMEGMRDRLRDRSGHNYHGTLKQSVANVGGAPTWVHLGYLHDALQFDGQSSAVDLPGALGTPSGPATFELVIRPQEIGRPQVLAAQGGELINVLLDSDGRLRLRHANARREFDDIVSRTALKPNEWAHIVGTYDMAALKVYINGRFEGEVKTDGLRSNEGARLGAPFWGGLDPRRGEHGAFKGQVARFRILQGASSPTEIARQYAQLAPLYARFVSR